MNESRALIVHQQLTPNVWEMVQAVAPAMYKSRLFGVTSPEAAMAIMIKGYELGMGLTASFEFVQVVEGKPALSPRGMLAMIHQHSDLVEVKVKESTDKSCTVWMKRKDTDFEFETTWTIEDAKKAGVYKPNSGWDKYPANMLRWRAIGFCADVVCPDLIGGMKRADELGADIDTQGNVIEGEWRVEAPVVTVEPQPTTECTVTLDALVTQYGADAVMEAAGGVIPSTTEELEAVAQKLAV